MAAMRPTPGRSAASPTARSTCASPTEQRGELLELSERQQAIAGMKELWLSKTRVLPSRRVWPLWLPRPDLGPPAAKVRDGSRAAEAPLAERTSGFGSNIKHRERRGWGAKQPVLPTEELWQLHLRDPSLIRPLPISQLRRKPSPNAHDPKLPP